MLIFFYFEYWRGERVQRGETRVSTSMDTGVAWQLYDLYVAVTLKNRADTFEELVGEKTSASRKKKYNIYRLAIS